MELSRWKQPKIKDNIAKYPGEESNPSNYYPATNKYPKMELETS